MKSFTYFMVVFLCFTQIRGAKKLPSYFPQCRRFDPNLNKCLLDAAHTVKPFLIKGVPDLSIPSIEPFSIPEITLQQGTQALNFKAVLHNVLIHGLSNYKFSKMDFDVNKLEFDAHCVVPNIRLDGKYNVTGRILVAPIVGQGKFTAEIDKADVKFYQKVKATPNKRGVIYVLPVHTNTTIKVDKPKAHLDGLFDGNEELNETTNRIINDNVDELFEDIRPVIEKVLSDVLNNLLLTAFEKQIPFDDLYPPTK